MHPQVVANGHIVEIDTPHWGPLYVDGLPWKFERTPAGSDSRRRQARRAYRGGARRTRHHR